MFLAAGTSRIHRTKSTEENILSPRSSRNSTRNCGVCGCLTHACCHFRTRPRRRRQFQCPKAAPQEFFRGGALSRSSVYGSCFLRRFVGSESDVSEAPGGRAAATMTCAPPSSRYVEEETDAAFLIDYRAIYYVKRASPMVYAW